MDKMVESKKKNVLIGVYRSSMRLSMIAMSVVGAIEIFMLIFTFINKALYGIFLIKYRLFYISLLLIAVIYILLNFYVKDKLESRYKLLHTVNPIFSVFFFAWALGITYSDALVYGTVDPIVFMTFSMSVPLIFMMPPRVYAVIAAVADGIILYLIVAVSGSVSPIINLIIFFIFQLILGLGFLRLKMELTERIVDERDRSRTDAMTGFLNRRAYIDDRKLYAKSGDFGTMTFLSADINGLKIVNDSLGHETGDRLIVGMAECLRQSFGSFGDIYRVGGDEFVGMLFISDEDIKKQADNFNDRMAAWSKTSGITLSASLGYVSGSGFSDFNSMEKAADKKMYMAKDEYYRLSGKDRKTF